MAQRGTNGVFTSFFAIMPWHTILFGARDLFCFFKNDIYNVLSGNFTVKQIINKIKKYKKNVKIKFVASKIMNQLSYHVSKNKINQAGLKLNSKIDKDIKETIKLLKNI